MMWEELASLAVEEALKLGADYADARLEAKWAEVVTVENLELKSYRSSHTKGIGIRVLVGGCWGFASTTILEGSEVRDIARRAFKIARALAGSAREAKLAEVEAIERAFNSPVKEEPANVSPEEKLELLMDMNKRALSVEGVKNAGASLASLREQVFFTSSEGARLSLSRSSIGILYSSTASFSGRMERAWDSYSSCAGWEFVKERDWPSEAEGISNLALEAAKARSPPAGTYPAVLDGFLVGLLIHEAFGHATEGDIVLSGDSALRGKLGEQVASEHVSIIDEGIVEGGFYIPFDDEGTLKGRTVVVKNGILKAFLTSRSVAAELGLRPTGNGRAQGFSYFPTVRQTNYYLAPGDQSLEELMEGIDYGLFLMGRSRGGGQVEPGMGNFTFRAGPSYVIRHGELSELVRGVAISGNVLETLKLVEGVGRDFQIRFSIFAGCGKYGQVVHVGLGGAPVRVKKVVVGGA